MSTTNTLYALLCRVVTLVGMQLNQFFSGTLRGRTNSVYHFFARFFSSESPDTCSKPNYQAEPVYQKDANPWKNLCRSWDISEFFLAIFLNAPCRATKSFNSWLLPYAACVSGVAKESGTLPKSISNGTNFVEGGFDDLYSYSTRLSNQSQFWGLDWTVSCSIEDNVLMRLSVCSSVWEWSVIAMLRWTECIFCSSCQNAPVNLDSRPNIDVRGTPCRQHTRSVTICATSTVLGDLDAVTSTRCFHILSTKTMNISVSSFLQGSSVKTSIQITSWHFWETAIGCGRAADLLLEGLLVWQIWQDESETPDST